MYRLSSSSVVVAGAFAVAAVLLSACPPPDQGAGSDTTRTGMADDIRYPFAVASIPVIQEATDRERRVDCFTRKFVNPRSAAVGGGRVRIAAHDSTIHYELSTLEEGEHFVAAMYDEGGAGLKDFALAPNDSTCWAVRADSVGLLSVFYGAEGTVLRPLTIDIHSERHEHAEADWVREIRYPASFRRFGATTAAPLMRSSWIPSVLAPDVAFASVAAAADTTDQGGSGPWTVCAAYGCCKPR